MSKLHVRTVDVDQLHFDDELRRCYNSYFSEICPALDLGTDETFEHAFSISELSKQPRRLDSLSVLNKKIYCPATVDFRHAKMREASKDRALTTNRRFCVSFKIRLTILLQHSALYLVFKSDSMSEE